MLFGMGHGAYCAKVYQIYLLAAWILDAAIMRDGQRSEPPAVWYRSAVCGTAVSLFAVGFNQICIVGASDFVDRYHA